MVVSQYVQIMIELWRQSAVGQGMKKGQVFLKSFNTAFLNPAVKQAEHFAGQALKALHVPEIVSQSGLME